MEYAYVFVRRHWPAFAVVAVVLGAYVYLTLRGSECFNCEQTEIYDSGQSGRRSSSYHRYHK